MIKGINVYKIYIPYIPYIMISRNILVSTLGGWTVLGFYRGIQHHDYLHKEKVENHRQKMAKYQADKLRYPEIYCDGPPTKPTKYVLSSVGYGFYGSICYINPVFTPLYFAKECYRVETLIRGFDGEKPKKYYQTLKLFD